MLLPDATVLHNRAAQKIRSQSRGHRYAEDLLIRLGAPTVDPLDPAGWLTAALITVGARRVRHPGNLRYTSSSAGAANQCATPTVTDPPSRPRCCEAIPLHTIGVHDGLARNIARALRATAGPPRARGPLPRSTSTTPSTTCTTGRAATHSPKLTQ
jgi:hypothetical protein